MKKYTKKIHKNQKGISLLALTITVLVMSVVTSVLVYNAKDGIAIRNYKNLENDIEILTSKVEAFYLEIGELPILKSNGESVLYSGNPNFKRQQQPNDNGAYYVINLNYLGGITLNYGKGFFDIKTIDDTKKITDVYIINGQSHRIYYAEGVQINGEPFYTIGEDSKVTLHNKTDNETENIN